MELIKKPRSKGVGKWRRTYRRERGGRWRVSVRRCSWLIWYYERRAQRVRVTVAFGGWAHAENWALRGPCASTATAGSASSGYPANYTSRHCQRPRHRRAYGPLVTCHCSPFLLPSLLVCANYLLDPASPKRLQ